MQTSVEICNSALVKLGVEMITDLDQDIRAAKLCKAQYPIKKRELLRLHPWNFAKDRASLAKLVAVPAFGYSSQFQLPADVLRVIEVNGSDQGWEIESGKILINADVCEVIYTKDVSEGLYDATFAETLSLSIAMALAPDLNPAQLPAVASMYQESLRLARNVNAQESNGRKFKSNQYLIFRR